MSAGASDPRPRKRRLQFCLYGQGMAPMERARSLGDGPAVTRRSHVTDVVPDDPVKRLTLSSRDVRLHHVME